MTLQPDGCQARDHRLLPVSSDKADDHLDLPAVFEATEPDVFTKISSRVRGDRLRYLSSQKADYFLTLTKMLNVKC